jgi:hypothetical protein
MDLLEGKMPRTSSRETISTKRQKIAALAAKEPKLVLTTLAHHVDIEWLGEAWRQTSKTSAPGVDGVSAGQYAERLEENLESLLGVALRSRSTGLWM